MAALNAKEKGTGLSTGVETSKLVVSQPKKLEHLLEDLKTIEVFTSRVSERTGEDRSQDMGTAGAATGSRKDDKTVKAPEAKQTEAPPAAPAVKPQPVAKKEGPAAAPVQKAPAARPAAKPAKVREYTIQVGSFASRDKAEQAARTLKDKGLTGVINSRTLNEAQFYRLRLGPYSSKGEAEKFLEWVKAIPGFQDSMIFETYGIKP